MRQKIVMGILILFLLLTVTALADQRMEYAVKHGDTRGDIELILKHRGVDIRKMDIWNPSFGMRDMKMGDKLIYYLPDTALPAATAADVKAEANKIAEAVRSEIAKANAEREQRERHAVASNRFYLIELSLGILLAVAFGAFFVWRSLRVQKHNRINRSCG